MESEHAMGFLQNFKIPAAQYFGKIWAIFQPVVGDFLNFFRTKGFSTVSLGAQRTMTVSKCPFKRFDKITMINIKAFLLLIVIHKPLARSFQNINLFNYAHEFTC